MATVSALALLALLACGDSTGEPVPSPTPRSVLFATPPSAASTGADDEASSDITVELNQTATPYPTATAYPTATPYPTPTPYPVAVGSGEQTSGPGPSVPEATIVAPQAGPTIRIAIPKKSEVKHPKADSAINSLVERVESGEITEEEAASEAPLHRGESVGVIILLSGNVDGVVTFLEANGASNINAGDDYIEAFVPVLILGETSEQPGVLRVDQIQPPGETQGDSQVVGNGPGVHGSTAWNDAGYSGQGIKVGVIDRGFSGFSDILGTEVPATVEARCYIWLGQHSQNLSDCSDGGTHGTIVSEAVLDIAPEATLYISDPQSLSELRDAVDWMISEGVSVINHSRHWTFDGPGDGTSPLSVSPLNSIDRAVSAGIVWVNAAGNQARGTWFQRGPLDYTTETIDGEEIRFLRFSGSEIRNSNSYIGGRLELRWEDEWGGAETDLDLFALASGTDEIALQSINLQSGSPGHNPFESVGSLATFDVMVAHRGGPEPDWIQLVGWGPTRLTLNSSGAGSIINPAESASPGMLAVGAAHWSNTNVLSGFSSRGPTPDERMKPDVVATNCGETATRNTPFCGTSQASPHVAGMAVLVRERFPNYTPAQVVSYIKDNAEQRISSPDPNNTWGHGFFVLPPVAQPPQPVPIVPGAASIASVTPGTSSLAVAWRAPLQRGGAAITAYDLRHIRSDAPRKADRNWTVVGRAWTGSGTLSQTLTGLIGGTRYDVQVRAVNSAGEGPWSPTRTGTPIVELTVPGTPIFVSVTPGAGSLSVAWSAPPDDGGSQVTSYDVRHIRSDALSKADASWTVTTRGPFGVGAPGHRLPGLTGGTRYDVQVRAVNAAGDGPWSATTTGTPLVQSVCEDSNVVPNALSNPLLVSDCETLLALKDTLRGTGSMNWSANVPVRDWNGIRLGDSPLRVTSLRIQSGMTGRIPSELGNLTGLNLLDLSRNRLAGAIPGALGNLSNLRSLYLQGNRLTGSVPDELGYLSDLEILYLWSNQLTGGIPSRLGRASSLEELSFSDNRLVGSIPTELGRLTNLTSLALARNSLSGPIPSELADLGSLQTLKLSGNRLTGCIPVGLRDVLDNDLAAMGLSDCAGIAPDLVVDRPTVSESAPEAGARFTLSATVRNQGNSPSAFTTLRYYRSADSTITTGDTEVGTDSVSRINALVTGDESVSLTAPSTPGTYYYGACVDSVSGETDTANNCSVAVVVTVGAAPAPDLVVDRPTVSESAPAAGERFTLTATVRNQGSGRSDSTTLRYYRSADSTITTGDTEVGTDSVFWLDALETGDESISLTAPDTSGTYYYGACVDALSDETDTANNCSPAVTVAVGAAPAPDLVVGMPTVSGSAPDARARFTLNAAVRNQGNGPSAFTTLRYYQSADQTITTGDTEVGTDSVSRLNALETGAESVSLTAPDTPGTYYYGACVDSVSDESDTANNCSVAVAVTVGAAPAPDLVVNRPTVSESSPDAGARFTLNATVRNQGNGASAFTTLRYYQSTDSNITTGDTEVGMDSVSRLDPTESSDESVSLTAPDTPGTYYYGACVDAVSDESDTANNCSAEVAVTVGAAPAPDLVVNRPTVSESSPAAGTSFTLNAAVRNQGNGPSDSTTLRYYQSTDSAITSGDTEVGTDSVSRINALGTGDESVSLTAPDTPGTHYYGACVDAVSDESDTANNCSAAATVTVGAAPAPDLVVNRPTVSESAPEAGARFTLNAAVRNQGNGPSAFTTLRYYRSTDSAISTGDTAVGTDSVFSLDALETGDESVILTAPDTPGTYYYGACVAAVSGESDTTNNCSSPVSVAVGSLATVPGAPTSLTATADGETEIDLSWTAPSDDGGTSITGYRIEVSNNGSRWSDLEADTGNAATTYSHTGLAAGTTRHYRVSAVNSAGTGTVSNTDDASTYTQQDTSPCAIGGAVPNAANNLELVADCEVLLASMDTLRGTIDLNWSASTPITDWEGIITIYRRDRVTWIALGKGLDGTIPAELGGLTELSQLSLTNNKLTGGIPAGLGNLSKLTKLSLSNNKLSGAIPAELGRLGLLESLDLSMNQLSGSIPGELGDLASLTSLRLLDNELSGAIPAALADLANLRSLIFSDNLLSGPIPRKLGNLSKLQTLSIADNQLTGAIPTELGKLTELYYLRLSNNQLAGAIPTELGNLVNLKLLYLSRNRLSGDVPAQLGNLRDLEGLTLQGNQLTGCVPEHLEGQLDRSTLWAVGVPFCSASTAPGAPTSLTATADDQTEIDLSWSAPSDDGGADITGYKIEVSTNGSSWNDLVADTNSTSTSYSHTGLTAGSTRHYRVSAINSEGAGPASNTDSATTDAATAPDLVLDAPTVSNSNPVVGTLFEFSITVRNQGNGAAKGGLVGYLISTDPTVTLSDRLLERSHSFGPLAPGETRSLTTPLTAPSTPGTYYYAACVRLDGTGEIDTTNNCSTSVKVTVSPPPAPDLSVDTPTVDDSTLETGDSFTLSATVRNGGDASSASTTLRYYRSTDSTITSSDTSVGTDSVSGLSAGGSSDESIDLTAPSTAGTYYYGACVDSVSGESETTNNCSSTVAVTVSAAPAPDPVQATTCSVDLVVSPGESCVYPGQSDEFSVDSSGRGSFLFTTAGERIEIRNSNINGVEYTLVASKQSDGTWKIEEVG